MAEINNATITYHTHSHAESGCEEGACRITANVASSEVRNDGRTYYTYSVVHSLCGSVSTSYTTSNANYNPSPSSHSYWTCGHTDGEITGATLTF